MKWFRLRNIFTFSIGMNVVFGLSISLTKYIQICKWFFFSDFNTWCWENLLSNGSESRHYIQEKIATFSPWKEFWIICFSWIRFEPKAPCQGKLANFEMFMRTPKARENIFAAVMKKILYIYTIILGKFAKNWLKF